MLPKDDFLRYALDLAGQPYQAYGTLGSQVVSAQAQDPGMAEIRAEFGKGLRDLWAGLRQLRDQLSDAQEETMQTDAG